MLTQEYLEIVKLAELLLMQQLPKKPVALPKVLAAPIESELPLPVAPKPVVVESKLPLPVAPKPALQVKEPVIVPKEIPSVEITPCNLDPILELLKTHCPKLKLIAEPQDIKTTVIVLFDQETEPEKKLLENITSALKKEGHTAHLLLAADLKTDHLQNPSNVLIGSKSTFSNQSHIKIHARRGDSGKLFIGESKALAIPSLSILIEQPSKRRDVWNEILELL